MLQKKSNINFKKVKVHIKKSKPDCINKIKEIQVTLFDLKNAFDTIRHQGVWRSLHKYRVDGKITDAIDSMILEKI